MRVTLTDVEGLSGLEAVLGGLGRAEAASLLDLSGLGAGLSDVSWRRPNGVPNKTHWNIPAVLRGARFQ